MEDRWSRPSPCPETERNQSMTQEGEPNQSMAREGEPNLSPIHGPGGRTLAKPNPESTHMERVLRLAMTEKGIRALGVRTRNHDRGLSLYRMAKLIELLPYCLLPREG